MEFSSNPEVRKIPEWIQEFIKNILFDESPLFISDEATIWDVSMSSPPELMKRCSDFYGVPVSLEDLRKPLWKLIRDLNASRHHRNTDPTRMSPERP